MEKTQCGGEKEKNCGKKLKIEGKNGKNIRKKNTNASNMYKWKRVKMAENCGKMEEKNCRNFSVKIPWFRQWLSYQKISKWVFSQRRFFFFLKDNGTKDGTHATGGRMRVSQCSYPHLSCAPHPLCSVAVAPRPLHGFLMSVPITSHGYVCAHKGHQVGGKNFNNKQLCETLSRFKSEIVACVITLAHWCKSWETKIWRTTWNNCYLMRIAWVGDWTFKCLSWDCAQLVSQCTLLAGW